MKSSFGPGSVIGSPALLLRQEQVIGYDDSLGPFVEHRSIVDAFTVALGTEPP